ncbi:MAG: hypothetical protein PVS3B2_03670 [Candidatus Dormibacteraceae bacterium]
MNKAIRWRIISLQAMLVIILASASGFLFYEGSFVTGMVHDQLVAQKIFFPGTDQVKAGGALDPAKFPVEVTQYAGTQVDNADKAKAYGNGFIGEHLKGIAGGMTYSEVSAAGSVAAKKAASADKSDPNYGALQADSAKLAGQKTTLFMGETLRGNLLNAWGWGTMGLYTTYAGIGLMLASLVVLGAVVFELVIVGRKESLEVKVARAVTA